MPDQQEMVEQVVKAARALGPGERNAYLEEACGKNAELRTKVEDRLIQGPFSGSELLPLTDSLETSDSTSYLMSGEGEPNRAGQLISPSFFKSRLSPGEVLGDRFLIIRFIASGGMGEVYEVEDRQLEGVRLALKTVLPKIAEDADMRKRFQREVLLARTVVHPHLCPIYDIFYYELPSGKLTFLTMKLIPGETLSARIKRQGQIDLPETTLISRQVASAIGAIHEQGILHRDIKASNIMLEGVGVKVCACLMDFGLAHAAFADSQAVTVKLAGTPAYMAPELFRGQPPTKAADVYAFGVVVYQMLTGRLPGVDSRNELLVEDSDLLEKLPAEWKQLIRGCLQPDAARRYQTVQDALVKVTPTYQSISESHITSRTKLSRRQMLQLAGGASAALAGFTWLDWPTLGPRIDRRIEDWRHPLPKKRFVALLDWPAPSDARLKPMLSGVVDAIASELQRAEAFDKDLYIIAQKTSSDLATAAQVNEIRDSLGANLVLAATGIPQGKGLDLLLRVLDTSTAHPLREKVIHVALDQQQSLPAKAVRVAAAMLDIIGFEPNDRRNRPRTENGEAYAAFQYAEVLRKQDNDTGLDAAIEKYKQALEIDPRYAAAQDRLAWAYLRSYGLHSDPAALSLARENAEAAISLDPSLVDAHVGLAWAAHEMGDSELAATEIAKALVLDPSDPSTLTYQANIYTANGRWGDAESTYKRILALRPNYWLAHNQLGFLLYSQGKYAKALIEFRAASLANPKNALALGNIGSVYLVQGKLPEALDSCTKSFSLNANDFAASTIAEVYRVQRNYPGAISFAQKAVELDPTEAFNWLELGDCFAASRTHRIASIDAYSKAVQAQEEQVRTESKNGSAWMLLALCRVKAGRKETAVTLIAKADLLRADDIDTQLIKARTLELLGRRGDALATLARCAQRGATTFQLASIPDLEGLRADPQYQKILQSSSSETDIHS